MLPRPQIVCALAGNKVCASARSLIAGTNAGSHWQATHCTRSQRPSSSHAGRCRAGERRGQVRACRIV